MEVQIHLSCSFQTTKNEYSTLFNKHPHAILSDGSFLTPHGRHIADIKISTSGCTPSDNARRNPHAGDQTVSNIAPPWWLRLTTPSGGEGI